MRELERLSRDFAGRLEHAGAEDIAQFLDLREQTIERIKQIDGEAPRSPGQWETIQRIASYDEAILNRMNQLKSEAEQGLSRVSKTRVQSKAYHMPYTPDGVYFDKKK